MADTSTVTVTTGSWVDYTHDGVLGHRFTLSSRHALILIAFISVFDGLVGNAVWTMLSYIIHQLRVTKEPRDGLYHQHQILLRNSPDPLNFAWQASSIGHRWRGRAHGAWWRGTSFSVLAISVSAVFSAAGILSSLIASSGEVLLSSTGCGNGALPFNASKSEVDKYQTADNMVVESLAQISLAYAQNCYDNPLASDEYLSSVKLFSPARNCDFFVTPSINWTTSYIACPFGDACAVDEAIVLDTGLQDSHIALGINQPQENRFSWRKVQTCAPLTSSGFSNASFYNISLENPGVYIPPSLQTAATYSYGHNVGLELDLLIGTNLSGSDNNYTFVYPYSAYTAGNLPYWLALATRLNAPASQPYFTPDPRILPTANSPLTLFFLANRALYPFGPVFDPWFRAADNYSNDIPTGLHVSNEPGNVLACIEQAQVCNPNSANCTDCCTNLDDWWTFVLEELIEGDTSSYQKALDAVGFTAFQAESASAVLDYFQPSSFFAVAQTLGQTALQAYQFLTNQYQTLSGPLPDIQWQVEMQNFMGISLAMLQQFQILGVTGPSDPFLLQYVQAPTDSIGQNLCRSQKIRSTSYQSFSVVGIAVNFVLGFVLILAAVFVRFVLPRIRKRQSMSQRAWIADSALQLQRTAYESLDVAQYDEYKGEEVPITRKGTLFRPPELGARVDKGATRPEASPFGEPSASSTHMPTSLYSDEVPLHPIAKTPGDERDERVPLQREYFDSSA